MEIPKKIWAILGAVIVLISLTGSIIGADQYLAKSGDLLATNLRLDYKINKDIKRDLLNDINAIEKKYGTNANRMPELIGKRYLELKEDLEEIIKILDQIRAHQIKKGS